MKNSRTHQAASLIFTAVAIANSSILMAATEVDDALTILDTEINATTAIILANDGIVPENNWTMINNKDGAGDLSFTNTTDEGLTTSVPVSISGGWDNALRVTSDGKIGINTFAPGGPLSSRLTISDPNLSSIFFDLEGTGTGTNFIFGSLAGVDDADENTLSNIAFIANVTAEPARIPFFVDENDNVGISSGGVPGARLHVGGGADAKVLVKNSTDVNGPRVLFELANFGNTKFSITNIDPSRPDAIDGVVEWAFANNGKGLNFSRQNSGTTEFKVLNNGNAVLAGTLVQNSDINSKQNIEVIDSQLVLAKVMELPISEWSYKDDPDSRHIGPMAQDFYQSFQLGSTDKGISSLDTGGVALAAIQELKSSADREIDVLRSENSLLRDSLELQNETLQNQQLRLLELELQLAELLKR